MALPEYISSLRPIQHPASHETHRYGSVPPSQTSTEFHLSHLRTASAARGIRESVAVEG